MIQSFPILSARGGVQYLVYDTVIDGKHVLCACGVGRVEKGDVHLTAVGRATWEALLAHGEQAKAGEVSGRVQEIAAMGHVRRRVTGALQAAENGEVLFFACRTPEIYDEAGKILNIQRLPPDTKQ